MVLGLNWWRVLEEISHGFRPKLVENFQGNILLLLFLKRYF